MNFDPLGRGVRAETEVDWAVARRSITDARGHVIVLRAGRRDELDPSADSVAIAFAAFE